MKKEKLKILLKKVGYEPEIKFIDNTLKAKQKIVGGLIEVLDFEDDTLIVCNEEGKVLNLPPNTIFDMDYIAGDYFVVGNDFRNADFKSLTDEQIQKVTPIINNKSLKYSNKQLKDISKNKPILVFEDSDTIIDFLTDYETELIRKLDNESNEHLSEDYIEKDFDC